MHFSNLNHGSGPKTTKFAVVAGIHVLVGTLFVHSLNTRVISLPKVEDFKVTLVPEFHEPPPPPPKPPEPMPKVAPPPPIVVPPVPIDVPPPPPDQPVIQATTTQADPTPVPAQPAQPEATPAAQPSNNTGAMRSAVLAEACATPPYPTNAQRNGDTGTVTLALLVGADGKVTSSRIQHSSGHRDLDKAALNALSMCRFKPAMNNGVAEAGWAQIAYVWKLDD